MFKLGESKSPDVTAAYSKQLWQAKIPHQVVSKGGIDEIWLLRQQDLDIALSLVTQPDQQVVAESSGTSPIVASLWQAPVVWLFILLSVAISFLTGFAQNVEMFRLFTIVDVLIEGDKGWAVPFEYTLKNNEWWRLVSPVFVHMGAMHIIFNMLWLWELGRKIEMYSGKLSFFGLVMVSAVISNLAQYLSGSILFGGMSGVVYALLGYVVVYDRLSKVPVFNLQKGVVIFMLVWLVLGFTQFTEVIGLGSIANTAHLVGLITGAAVAALVRLISPSSKQMANPS